MWPTARSIFVPTFVPTFVFPFVPTLAAIIVPIVAVLALGVGIWYYFFVYKKKKLAQEQLSQVPEDEKISFPVQPPQATIVPTAAPQQVPFIPQEEEINVVVAPTVPMVPVPHAAEFQANEAPAKKSVAERLSELEGIREMIGEESYNEKKKEIISDL